MLNAGEKNSNSCVVRKKILNETKNHNPPPPPPPFKLNGWSLTSNWVNSVVINTALILNFIHNIFKLRDTEVVTSIILLL